MDELELSWLSAVPPDRMLDCIEAEVWAGVAAQEHAGRRLGTVVMCQIGFAFAAFSGGMVAGTGQPAWHPTPPVAAAWTALSPTNLLLGSGF